MTAVFEKLDKSTTMINIVFAVQEARRQHRYEYFNHLTLFHRLNIWKNLLPLKRNVRRTKF